jgi:pimeloyl-ACP methyl ester carboxylesterase
MDVIRDLAFWPKSVKRVQGHAGFVSGWREAFRMISDEIVDNPHKPIILTGHSLGGAIAIVGAYNLLEIGCRVEKVVTFGAPRAIDTRGIDQAVGREMKARVFEYIHKRDPIPFILRFTRYRHVNKIMLGNGTGWLMRRVRFHMISSYIDLM